MENWKTGLGYIKGQIILGHGFRASASPTSGIPRVHSGYITLLLETGAVGTVLVLGTLFTEIVQRIFLIFRVQRSIGPVNWWSSPWTDTLQLNSIVVGVLMLTLIIWVYEPIYMNLGSPLSLLLFLMLTAPKYAPGDTSSEQAFTNDRVMSSGYLTPCPE